MKRPNGVSGKGLLVMSDEPKKEEPADAVRFSDFEYDAAIQALQDAKGQLRPDGRPCAICHDSGHQAWGCWDNPVLLAARYKKFFASADELHLLLHRILPL